MSLERASVVQSLRERILSIQKPHPIRVAIDGVDAAGKTTLADELATGWACQRDIIRSSIDHFHFPRAHRYRQGPDSPRGYYEDSFDYPQLKRELLEPLGPGGNLSFRSAVFDYRTEEEVEHPRQLASPNSILLFDGIFLLRPELEPHWDLKIFLEVDFEVSVPRALERLDTPSEETRTAVLAKYRQRYIPGQQWYFEVASPLAHADIVIDNGDLDRPTITLVSR